MANRTQRPAGAVPGLPADQPVWLGIYGNDVRGGVQIQRVVPGAAAARAGLLGAQDPAPRFVRQVGVRWTGHIILGVDGRRVRSMAELQRALSGHRPGDRVTLLVAIGNGEVSGETVVQLDAPPVSAGR